MVLVVSGGPWTGPVSLRKPATFALRTGAPGTQRELALTHHLNAMEDDGLVTRRRDPGNRRVHVVELTPAGEALFGRLRTAAVEHDRRVREGLTGDDLDRLEELLERLHHNVSALTLQ